MGRIIILLSGTDPSAGGGGHTRYVRTQARASIEAGYEPHIFCAHERDEVIRTDYGVIHRVASPFRPFRLMMVVAHGPYVGRSLERFLRDTPGPHLIHSSGGFASVGAKIAARLRRRGIEVVHVATIYDLLRNEARAKLRGVTREHGVKSWLIHLVEFCWIRFVVDRVEGRGYRSTQCLIVNYESVRQLLRRSYGLDRTIRILPYTSETAYFQNSNGVSAAPAEIAKLQPRTAPLIVCASRHDPRKGIDVLLRALGKLHDAGVPFRACLVGRGVLLNAHVALQQRLGLTDCVAITGFVPESFNYLQQADIFVLPSLEEGSGSMSLIEALQVGLAVVASGVDGIPEDVVHEESALLVRPNDPEELSAALRRLLEDGELRRRLADRARGVFEERFSPQRFSAALRATYEELGFK